MKQSLVALIITFSGFSALCQETALQNVYAFCRCITVKDSLHFFNNVDIDSLQARIPKIQGRIITPQYVFDVYLLSYQLYGPEQFKEKFRRAELPLEIFRMKTINSGEDFYTLEIEWSNSVRNAANKLILRTRRQKNGKWKITYAFDIINWKR